MAVGLIAGWRCGARAGRRDRVPGSIHAGDRLPLYQQPLRGHQEIRKCPSSGIPWPGWHSS